jgi:hypothetical protein
MLSNCKGYMPSDAKFTANNESEFIMKRTVTMYVKA